MRILGGLFLVAGVVFVFLSKQLWSVLGPMMLGSTYNDLPAFQQPPAGLTIAGITFLFVGVILFAVGFMMKRSSSNANRIQATGIPGTAIILGAADTGVTINDNPRVSLVLQVTAGGNTYQANVVTTVPRLSLGRLTPGTVLVIKVDPAKPSAIVIDWQAVPAASV